MLERIDWLSPDTAGSRDYQVFITARGSSRELINESLISRGAFVPETSAAAGIPVSSSCPLPPPLDLPSKFSFTKNASISGKREDPSIERHKGQQRADDEYIFPRVSRKVLQYSKVFNFFSLLPRLDERSKSIIREDPAARSPMKHSRASSLPLAFPSDSLPLFPSRVFQSPITDVRLRLVTVRDIGASVVSERSRRPDARRVSDVGVGVGAGTGGRVEDEKRRKDTRQAR